MSGQHSAEVAPPMRRPAVFAVAALVAWSAVACGAPPPEAPAPPSEATPKGVVAGPPAPLLPGERYLDRVIDHVEVSEHVYRSTEDATGTPLELRLDLYRPAADPEVARPAIVWVHGGSFRAGSPRDLDVRLWASEFAHRGYVVAAIEYRLDGSMITEGWASAGEPGAREAVLAAREDAQAAVRYLRAHDVELGIDAGRIAVAGTSAGAVTAIGLAADAAAEASSRVCAAVALAGALYPDLVEAGAAPVLFFHGARDNVIPLFVAEVTIEALRMVGARAELVVFPEAGHLFLPAVRQQVLERAAEWLRETTVEGCAAGAAAR